MIKNEYTASDIQQLKGLQAVRKRPGMYIGGTDVNGLHHLVWEIVDNSIDEALAGYANEISVTLKKDYSVVISDNGRGIPVDKVKGENRTAVELVFTELHAGGKFQEGAYKTSGGLHGVGSSVVNALSTKLSVIVSRNGLQYLTEFEQDKIITRTKEIGTSKHNGTIVQFWPDYKLFKNSKLNVNTISERLKESSFLISGLRIKLTDENTGFYEEYEYQNGLKAFLEFLNDSKESTTPVAYFSDQKRDIEVEFAFQWTDSYNDFCLSFVNNVKTRDGGTHETGLKTAFTKVFNEFANKENVLKGKNSFDGDDIREGLSVILSLKIPEKILEFVGQTKDKLGTPDAKSVVEEIVSKHLELWIAENKQVAKKVLDKIKRAFEIRQEERKRRLEARKSKNVLKEKTILSDKLTPATSKKPEEKELFLVEGDSAGGSAKSGRNRQYQAILPLRGKVINCEKSKLLEILKNTEIGTIINTIGAGFGKDFDLSKAQYGKVIIMTDADTDGSHIQILLLTFFYRLMKPLIEDGRVYFALPPLYKITNKTTKKYQYAWDDDELSEIMQASKSNIEIQRYKGLGEMNADQLWETTMNPETRTLIRATIEDASLAERRVSALMGENPQSRKNWIDKNIDFTNDDDFLEKIQKI
ncbi:MULTISPECIES: DNA topoisomerase IV subunit B [unclassified Mycoplasma]|uniref:DNA topoisomerase IV subunit B n=1 Tax=unclassified Mycoplasma TaxID=2683645 RepID=UPI00211BD8E6|nr:MULTISPECIES: DNA topoisomerase IV subunit B [unclassified Mycoplasma]UUM19830.1 DNA topoisomerase IV subunit B [Mycoplasma sp. 1578d]UUM24814.1 DNA topoisomerase IV subunit B [Mycoplasma sp. 3686d]